MTQPDEAAEMRTDIAFHTDDPQTIKSVELMAKLINIGNPRVEHIRGKHRAITDWVAVAAYVEELQARTRQQVIQAVRDVIPAKTATHSKGWEIIDAMDAVLTKLEKESL